MNYIRLPTNSDLSSIQHLSDIKSKSTQEEQQKTTDITSHRSMRDKVPDIQEICDKFFPTADTYQNILKSKSTLRQNQIKNLKIQTKFEVNIQGKGPIEDIFLKHLSTNKGALGDSDNDIYQFFRNLKDQGLLTKTNENGERVELTDEEFNDLVDKAKQFVSKYYELIDKENEFEHDKEEEIHLHQIDYGTTNLVENSRSYKASKVNEKQEQTPKIFFTILLAFTRAQMEMQQEKSKIKKEQMREIADEVRRLSNKLKDLHQEEAHQEIQMANIKNEELKKTASKLSKTKLNSFLTPLQQFSRASGGLKLIQVEGDSSSPLRTRTIREFYLEPTLNKKEREVSLLHIQHQ